MFIKEGSRFGIPVPFYVCGNGGGALGDDAIYNDSRVLLCKGGAVRRC